MTSRTIIGQAEGILMERLGIDADQAFAYLRRVSQSENRKLIMICSEIVKTRRLPSDHLVISPWARQPPLARPSATHADRATRRCGEAGGKTFW